MKNAARMTEPDWLQFEQKRILYASRPGEDKTKINNKLSNSCVISASKLQTKTTELQLKKQWLGYQTKLLSWGGKTFGRSRSIVQTMFVAAFSS